MRAKSRRSAITVLVVLLLFFGFWAFVHRGVYSFLDEYHPSNLDPGVAKAIEALPLFGGGKPVESVRSRFLTFRASVSSRVLARLQDELTSERQYVTVNRSAELFHEFRMEELQRTGKDPGGPIADEDALALMGNSLQIWEFRSPSDRVRYVSGDVATFALGLLGQPAPSELSRGGCVVLIWHHENFVESSMRRVGL
jgi:hypothetical protein